MVITRPALYVVGTPIGNLSDLSPRAVEILREADFIAAEDTRVTRALLTSQGIKNQLISYRGHIQRERGAEIVARLKAGECCALVSDAGMPAISDPGEDLVRLCAEAGIPVHSVPGPSAFVTALALSGLPTGRFAFEGFLSVSRKSRTDRLAEIKDERRTLLFYEAPHKLRRTLRDFLATFGDRRIAICRELTKLHEEVLRLTLSEAVEYYKAREPLGEYVLVVEGAPEPEEAPQLTPEHAAEVVAKYREQGLSKNECLRRAAEETGLPRNELYKLLLEEK